ncbi:MurR/RpiR family transcriptional regulator [Clostridium botulinum]|uniref:MurR/RpiR family transcriptional regulator n=1 Tax=Clostridium botulinum TaxID=1491 RepID=A0A6G4HP05_CLOBO|nr:MurR/RpiR family transcriptional regulator [Clostridium botulinum]NFQ62825.1 MurR/RpiR family transcriptional regulator [Clostridium botulinum]NFR18601.1 MurR/RpiR family transcriptional regulator [Clostridium botulinum]NFU17029.1 MurR/RpiR family transcriptional regulator [Clostridium botulinum]NFU19738.1 MurR/RpiR family transcriptional regulator [Clostridium botulinum]
MVIEVNKSIFDSLTETEKTVVKYINSNESNIPKMSIVDVAEKSFTSPATVSRTIKKCGLEGFSELRYKISANHDSKKVNEILGKSLIEVTKTIENISVENVLKTVRLIKEAKRIYILARGLTELVAQEFNLKLELLGYNTFLIVDPNIMRKICKTLDKEELVIVFSLKIGSPEIVESAESAVKTGAKLITCCCVKNSKLENLSDITLIGYKQSRTAIKEFEVTSRLPLFIISRAIIDYLII